MFHRFHDNINFSTKNTGGNSEGKRSVGHPRQAEENISIKKKRKTITTVKFNQLQGIMSLGVYMEIYNIILINNTGIKKIYFQ